MLLRMRSCAALSAAVVPGFDWRAAAPITGNAYCDPPGIYEPTYGPDSSVLARPCSRLQARQAPHAHDVVMGIEVSAIRTSYAS